jgi:hypothetical protein
MQTKTLQEINRRAVWLSSLAALIAIGPWIAAGPWIWPSIKEPSESWLSIALLTSPLWLMWLFAWVGWWLLAMYWVMQFRFLEPHRVLFYLAYFYAVQQHSFLRGVYSFGRADIIQAVFCVYSTNRCPGNSLYNA